MKKREPIYATEAELCADFTTWAAAAGWRAYAEAEGFDILLVHEDGRQIGVQAKLCFNGKVITQILPSNYYYDRADAGPDHRIVLVGEVAGVAEGMVPLLGIVGIKTILPEGYSHRGQRDFRAHAYEPGHPLDRLHDFNPMERCRVPEFANEQPAGVPAPVQLSHWKIGALRVLALLEVRGWVDRNDVKRAGCDPRRFCATDGWLEPAGERGRWARGKVPEFDKQHPTTYAAILAEVRASLESL